VKEFLTTQQLAWREAERLAIRAPVGRFSEGLMSLTREESPMGVPRNALENQSTSVVTNGFRSSESRRDENLGNSSVTAHEAARSAELRATTESRNAQGNQAPDLQSRAFRPPLSEQGVTEAFRTHNEKRRAQGELLRAEVARIDGAAMPNKSGTSGKVNRPSRLLTAREVRAALDLAALDRTEPPTLRAVQIHLQAYRHERFERLLEIAPGRALREALRIRGRRK
jgi:hypothetical protein